MPWWIIKTGLLLVVICSSFYSLSFALDDDSPAPGIHEIRLHHNSFGYYFGILAGGLHQSFKWTTLDNYSYSVSAYTYGIRAGVVLIDTDFAKYSLGVAYFRSSYQYTDRNEIFAQILLQRVSGTGFYGGLETGKSGDLFLGAIGGYEFFLSRSFSIGAELHWGQILNDSYDSTIFRYNGAVTLHL